MKFVIEISVTKFKYKSLYLQNHILVRVLDVLDVLLDDVDKNDEDKKHHMSS